MVEKRSTPRIQPYVAPCLIEHDGARVSGYLTDLSPRGAQVACDADPPAAESVVTLEVRLPQLRRRCRVAARVRWSRKAKEGHACGLTFEHMDEEDRAAIEAVIEEIRRRAALLGGGA